jgi:hypothetical protein
MKLTVGELESVGKPVGFCVGEFVGGLVIGEFVGELVTGDPMLQNSHACAPGSARLG